MKYFLQRWLDPNKSFRKQWINARDSGSTTIIPTLEFRVKFFVIEPSRLQEEFTRYQFYLQIKRDILQGRLPVPLNTACLLASYSVQSELGDFDPKEHTQGYIKTLNLLGPLHDDEAERRIMELHKLHRGQLPADAEFNYLEHAKRQEFYGIDFHKATDSSGKEINLGVCSTGLLVYQNQIRINTFSWSKMVKVSFKRKEFFIQLRREASESYDTLLGFGMSSHKAAKVLWKACVEHHSFFRLQRPQRTSRVFPITLGSKFHYTGRTELQTVEENKQNRTNNRISSKLFARSPSKRASTPVSNGNESNGNSGNAKNNQSILKTLKITSKQSQKARKAWEPDDEEGGFVTSASTNAASPALAPNSPKAPSMLEAPPAYSGENLSTISTLTPTIVDENMVTIRLIADDKGRFGFNVKGGANVRAPVLVSRVAPNTPADLCTPPMREGDQVVVINGHNVHGLTHEEIISHIRGSLEYTGELTLVLRPREFVDIPIEDEPVFQYVPDDFDHPLRHLGADVFTQSLLLLSDGLASGALVSHYENLYRKNPDLAITEAKKTENLLKNRYRDISPCEYSLAFKKQTLEKNIFSFKKSFR